MFGIKVSQPGVDADQAADYQLAFSSEWPTLKIFKTQSFSITDISQPHTIYTHGLDYPPAFMIQTTTTTGRGRIASPGYDEHGDGFFVDDNVLGYDPNLIGGPTGTFQGQFFIFVCNLLVNYQAPALTVGTSSLQIGGTTSEGIIASMAGSEAAGAAPQNLSIDSEARSPLIHMVQNGNLTGGPDYALVANHNLDYAPWFLTFITTQDGASGAGRYQAFFGGNGTNIMKTTAGTVEQHSTLSYLRGSIVILKDPFFL